MPSHRGHRRLVPDSDLPGLNYSILSGTLLDAPRPGRNPVGQPVTLLRAEFPVADPERPQRLWTWATCEIEVPSALAERHSVGDLDGGAAVLVAGQLSERWAVSGGRSSKRGAIVAALVRPEQRADHESLLIPGGRS
jgi:hypothetical protein